MDNNNVVYPVPLSQQFTIYSRSGCPYCIKVKKLLEDKNLIFTIIDCDEYISEDKIAFLMFIIEYSGLEPKTFPGTFPIVFYDKTFLGGYMDTVEYCEKMLTFSKDDF